MNKETAKHRANGASVAWRFFLGASATMFVAVSGVRSSSLSESYLCQKIRSLSDAPGGGDGLCFMSDVVGARSFFSPEFTKGRVKMSGMFRFSVSVYAMFAAVLFMALLSAAISSPALAQENVVTVASCTEVDLRQAIADAPAGATINFGCDGKITLTKEGGPTPIEINKDLTIDGAGRDVTISGGGEVGLFFNTNLATFTLKNLTLTEGAGLDSGNGFGGGSSGGGAVYNVATLMVEKVTFKNNEAFDAGGAIYSRGAFAETSVTDSTFEGNYVTCSGICSTHGGGGAIAALAGGGTNITDSVFRGNTAFGKDTGGGAILGRRTFNKSLMGPISISGSAFEDNKALTTLPTGLLRTGGGAVSVFNHELTITGSEFTDNEATNADSAGNPGVGFNLQAFGGAVLVESETVPGDTAALKGTTISDTTFTANAATVPASFGGAMFILRAPTSITRGTFTENTSEKTGAIDNAEASLDITDSTIKDNTAIGARDEGITVGGVATRSRGTQTVDGRQFKGKTTFTGTEVSNNVNGNCATESDGEITDSGGNSETPGASCGFNGETRVETERPDALDDGYEAEDGTTALTVSAPGVLENDADPEDEAMSAEIVGEPENGTVALEKDGSFVYTPDAGDVVGDTFTYRVKSPDGLRQSRVAKVTIDFFRGIVVDTGADEVADDGKCTLREAVASANTNVASGSTDGECAAGSGRDKISFDLPDDAKITLGEGQIEVSSSMTIDGSDVENLSVSGGEESRVFFVGGERVEISDLTITEGVHAETAGFGGGGVFVLNRAELTLANVLVAGNTSKTEGGGVENIGTLTVRESTFTDNTSEGGGAISNDFGLLTVEASTLSQNTSTNGGGGILSSTGDFFGSDDSLAGSTIRNSTISGNTADSGGGGVHNKDGLTSIENSTITKNTAPEDEGSGVASFGNDQTRTKVSASIIAANGSTDVDFVDENINSFQSNGYNLIGDGNAAGGANNVFDQTGDQVIGNVSPGLERLADNGGPTGTHALKAGSPALDTGDPDCPPPATDQRGMERPKDGNGDGRAICDIGAFEAQFPPPPESPTPTPKPKPKPKNPNACTIVGTPGNDILRGTPGRDVICGLGGNDIIRGMGGNDRLVGGSGNDILHGGAGNDALFGGAGRDILRGEGGNDFLFARDGVRGNDIADGGPGRDGCAADARDRVISCP